MNKSLFDNAFQFFGLLRKQAGMLAEAARKLNSLFGDFTSILVRCREIEAVIAEGDAVCREIERELSLTFIESVEREDIRDLNRAFERTFHAVRAVSSRVALYEFRTVEKGSGELASSLAEMAAELGPMLEMVVRKGDGAAGRERVRKLKKESDMFLLVGLGAVYESAGGKPDRVLEAVKWSQIYDRLEEVASCLEHAANVIERMIQKKV